MKEVDNGQQGSDNSQDTLTPDSKIRRLETIRKSAKKVAAKNKHGKYFRQKFYCRIEIDHRVIQELIELGINPYEALRLSEKSYSTFDDFDDY